MRPRDIISALLFAFLLAWIFLLLTERKVEDRVRQKEIDGLKRTNEKQRDSLELILKLKNDSLTIAFETIRTASAEREEAYKRTQATIRNLQRIIFITHTDSSRNAELTKLYPSFKP